MIVHARRASALLFHLLRHRGDPRPYFLPANICPIVPITFLKAGQPFRLLDIDPEDLGLDQGDCLRCLESDPDAYAGLLYARPYGAVEEISSFFRAVRAAARDLFIIDDRCLCHPDIDGTELTPEADATLYSTGHAKPVDLGWGGFVHLRQGVNYSESRLGFDPSSLEAVEGAYKAAVAEGRRFEDHDQDWLDTRPPEVEWEGFRNAVLKQGPQALDHRQRLNRIYSRGLPASIQLPERFHGWRFQIRVPEPAALLNRLRAAGLFASRHYGSLGRGIFAVEAYIHAESLAEEIVNLFNDHHYAPMQAVRTVEVILEHLRQCEA